MADFLRLDLGVVLPEGRSQRGQGWEVVEDATAGGANRDWQEKWALVLVPPLTSLFISFVRKIGKYLVSFSHRIVEVMHVKMHYFFLNSEYIYKVQYSKDNTKE